MSTEKRFFALPYRAYWTLLAGLLVIALWAYLTMPTPQEGDGDSIGIVGDGSGGFGNGPGSGKAGDGPGSGTAGEERGAGSGEKSPQPEGTQSGEQPPTEESHAEAEPSAEGSGSSNGIEKTEQLPEAPVARPLQTAEPVVSPASQSGGGSASGRSGFYGTGAKHPGKVLFLIDLSGSMEGASQEFPGKTKLEVLKMELTKSICGGNLTPTAATYQQPGGFIITCFSTLAHSIPREGIYRYRKRDDVKKSLEEIGKLGVEGSTDMTPGWDEALDRVNAERIDAVYFLTDGEPTDGFTAGTLEDMLKAKKVSKKLQINCISIGSNSPMLKEIADKHRGKYVFLP